MLIMLTIQMESAKFNLALKKFMLKSSLSEDKIIRKVAFDLLSNMLQPEP